ncbi:MAG: hypothetical protein GYA87_07435 [Christensenellaceae bacterium]|nr:hypothetical protein [Christensenellaceae bacterium]
MFKKYKFGFDIWALLLFLIIMVPNFIWLAIPAPKDILRVDSTTKTIDTITAVFQFVMIASLCFIKNSKCKKISINPLIVSAIFCCVLYYLSWLAYYNGFVGTIIILGLTVPPCLAFLLYAMDRKNIIAIISVLFFTVGHLIYAVVNFIV